MRKVLFMVGVLGSIAVFFLVFRGDIYLGSKFDFRMERLTEQFSPSTDQSGEEVVYSSGLFLVAQECGRFNWGSRWVAQLLVRAIPRQLWPTKYEDLGFGWVDEQTSSGGYTNSEWLSAVGFPPARGSAAGFDVSWFLDFSWFGCFGCYLFGMFFAYLWLKERSRGGIWEPLYIVALAWSILVPTQEQTVFLMLWGFLSVPTALLWWILVVPASVGRSPPIRIPVRR